MFYIADATRDGTTGGVGPYWADTPEDAERLAFEQFSDLWPDETEDKEDWDDFIADCDGHSLYTIEPVDALVREGRVKLEVAPEEARLILASDSLFLTPDKLHLSGEATAVISNLLGSVRGLSQQIEQMRGMFADSDGAIAEALEDGQVAAIAARAFINAARDAATSKES